MSNSASVNATSTGSGLPLVSILIPAYNAAPFLADTIHSALAQTWPHKEIIVVDDGSADDTLAVARRFESQGVKVVTQKNQGAAATRNALFALSRGDYIQWLDADDLLNPVKVESQACAAVRDGDVRNLYSSGWAYFRFRPHKARFLATALWNDLSPIEWMTRKLELNLHMQTATWLVSRELSLAAGPWNTKLLGDDDGEYFARVMMASRQIRFVPESKVFYRISPASRLSHIGRSAAKMEAQFHSMELNIQYIRSVEDSLRVRAACVTYLQRFLPFFYPEMPAIVKRAEELAVSLGGKLHTPSISWKYWPIQKIFGWTAAKAVSVYYNQCKSWVLRIWDKTMFQLEGKTSTRLTFL
ncbi:MAG: hypothetical protein RLY20_901 [Verrucomicrobiota bacterium]|jgi:GT2 family glycosyltransferase